MNKKFRRARLTTAATAVALLALTPACSSFGGDGGGESYPDRTIEIVVGFNAGGALDLAARKLVDEFPSELSSSAVVVNQAGDGGVIGASTVFDSDADGYTAYFGSVAAMTMQPWRQDSSAPYGGPDDYTPVANVIAFPQVLSVPVDAPYDTPQEFVDYATENPGKARVGTGGVGTLPDVALSMMKSELDLDVVSVPFQGFAQSVPAVLGGNIEGIISSPADVRPHVDAGDLKVIGSFNEDAVPGFPDVESFTSAGMEYTQDNYYFLLLPEGVDDAIVTKLQEAVRSVTEDDEFVEWAEANGALVQYQDAEELTERLQSDYERYEAIIDDLGL